MGKVAVKYSDRVVVTSDNPRFEEPKAIIDDILKGIDADKREKVLVVEDRKEAIRVAVLTAPADSLILIAGKGHEDYQEVKGTKYHFSDIEILETLKS
jgi:UDP-N-acetylmuramoyl-L-alanyl-D-glutamate--2,6-diaminopimelate ligase